MKGLFIPDITTEMFRNGCLEGIEALMAEGELYDIEYNPKQPTIEPEIVRCKDCKYSDTDNTLGVMFCWRISYHEADEDGFCSWAERRTDVDVES